MSFWTNLLGLFLGRSDRAPATRPTDTPAPAPQPRPEPVADSPPPPSPPPPPPPPPPLPTQPETQPATRLVVRDVIRLGSVDAAVLEDAWSAYFAAAERLARVPLAGISHVFDKLVLRRLPPAGPDTMTVSALQSALGRLGFYSGGEIDGICGYRTVAAVRLFQENVRTMENVSGMVPDGLYGPMTHAHLVRWLTDGHTAEWRQQPGEHDRWLQFLSETQARYAASNDPVQQAIRAFDRPTDTRKPGEWVTHGENQIHLIGVRREEFSGRFDDIFILLIDGLVFKFQGSTEPGSSSHPRGRPFLVPGQHAYHFGWHQSTYRALRPETLAEGRGVLIIRSGANARLDLSDLQNGLEPNYTINIHWAGKGLTFNVGNWSEGCQVITGAVYINPADHLVDCSSFAATNNTSLAGNPGQTRGAYTVLADLITAGSGATGLSRVNYTMVTQADLESAPDISARLKNARDRVVALVS